MSRSREWRVRGALSIALPLALAQAGLAHGQTPQSPAEQEQVASQPTDGMDIITVTAQKREENIQDVPIAITAMNAKTLEDRGVESIAQLTDFAPNVQIDYSSPFAGSSQILSAFIRGIGQNDFAFNLEPGVGTYVDGVYYARTIGAVVDLMDVERVEILKGPQGTLFGRNTIGGAISVVTRRPSGEFSFDSDVTIGEFDRTDIRGIVSFPIIDEVLSGQLAFAKRERGGYQDRIDFPGASGFVSDRGRFITSGDPDGDRTQGGQDATNLRLALRWQPSADVDVNLAIDNTRSDEEATGATLIDTYQTGAALPLGLTMSGIYNYCINTAPAAIDPSLAAVCGPRGAVGTALAGVNVDADPNNNRLPFDDRFITGDIDTSYARGSNFSVVDTWGATLTTDWEMSDNLSLRGIFGYRNLESAFGAENGGAPLIVIDTSFQMNQKQYSGEFQVNYDAFDGRWKSVTGLFYFHEEGDLLDTVQFMEGLVQVVSPNVFDNDAWAIFTHNNIALTDKLGLTLGVRYTEEEKQFEGGQEERNRFGVKLGLPPFLYPDPTNLDRVYPLGVNELAFDNTSVRAGVEYHFTPDILGYVSYSDGFKSGGWQTRLVLPATAVYGSPEAPTFDPEEASAYEVGLKTELFDRRLRLNAAYYYTDYSNIQVTVVRAGAPSFENGGAAEVKGFEVEAQAALPGGLKLFGSVGYTDAQFTELSPLAPFSLDAMFVNTPEWTTNIGLDYDWMLSSGRVLGLHASYSHNSEVAKDTLNTPILIQDAYGVLDASLDIEISPNVELTLGGRNLTDERYLITGNHNTDVGAITGNYSRPREWYATLRVRN